MFTSGFNCNGHGGLFVDVAIKACGFKLTFFFKKFLVVSRSISLFKSHICGQERTQSNLMLYYNQLFIIFVFDKCDKHIYSHEHVHGPKF